MYPLFVQNFIYFVIDLRQSLSYTNNKKGVMLVITKNESNFFLDFEIGNAKVMISNSGGFFKDKFTYREGGIHSHSSYEFHIVFEGAAALETKEGNYPLYELEACVVPPNIIHYPINGLPECTRMSFCFAFDKSSRRTTDDVYSHLTEVFGKLTCVTKIHRIDNLGELIKDALSEFYSQSKYQEYRLAALFTLIITELVNLLEVGADNAENARSEGSSRDNDMRALMRTIMQEYVNLRFALNPSLTELATLIHFSTKQTARLFEKNFGTSFKQYILKMRIDSAKYMLANSTMSVEEIANKVGYSSYNGFYRIFSLQVGQSPLEYRKEEKEK